MNHLIGEVEFHGADKFNPRNGNIFAIDTETTGLDPWGEMGVDRKTWPARPFAFSLCDRDGNKVYIRWKVDARTRRVIKDQKTFRWLQNLLADESLAKVFHNFQFDNRMLKKSGFKLRGEFHDTLIRHHVIIPNEVSYGLKPLSKEYLGIPDDDQKSLLASVIRGRRLAKKEKYAIAEQTAADYWLGDPELCREYAEIDAYRTMALFIMQEEALQDPGLAELYGREQRLMLTIERMETRGVVIDEKRCREIAEFYGSIAEEADRVIQREASKHGMEDFNDASPVQMKRLFFGKLGLKPLAYSRKGKSRVYVDCQFCKGDGCKICQNTGRNPKCDGEFLESIGAKTVDGETVEDNPLAWQIMRKHAAKKMMGFVGSYLTLGAREGKDLIIHPNYRQAGPKTGRLACSKPNLQNVASDESGKRKTDVPYRPREAFVPREGFMLYIPDYSQIEVWVLALLSKDQDFIGALAQGGDAHQIVADMVYHDAYDKGLVKQLEAMSPEELSRRPKKEQAQLKLKKTLRKQIKTLNFGIIYGQGDDLTAKSLGVSVGEAKAFKRQYFETFPAVQKFMAHTSAQAKKQGYVVSPYHRVYPIERGFEYRATNYMIQGSAADLGKNAMNAIDELSLSPLYRGKIHLQLAIHDELMMEIRKDIHCERTMRVVADRMSDDYEMLGSPIRFPIGMKIAYERWNVSQEISL